MTNYHKEIIRIWLKAFASAIVALLMAFMLFAMCGCRSNQEPMIERHYHTEMQTDSLTHLLKRLVNQQTNISERLVVMNREKIVYHINEDGDTIGTDREHEIDRSYTLEKENKELRVENDSLRSLAERRDTVYRDVPYPVERKLSRWERTKMNFGGIAFGGVGASVIVIALLAWLARKRRK